MKKAVLLSKDKGNHPRRCQARLKARGGEQCKNWALKGVRYCKFHGGRLAQKRGQIRTSHLPKFYRHVLSKTLAEAVDEMLGVAPEEQLSLFEELAIMRKMAGDAIQLYTLAEEKKKNEAKVAAAELMRVALKDVVSVCESAARVSALGKDKISIHDIQYIINQIVRVAHDTLEETDARRFEKALHTHVRLPVKDQTGTDITPDMDVSDMDVTIPNMEEEECSDDTQ